MPHHQLIIAVITYKRPETLLQTIQTLGKQNIPDSVEASLLVIDNDKESSAKEVVNTVKTDLPIHYIVVPEKGIPHARNAALDYAQNASYLAFIDDDDLAAPDWIYEMWMQLQESRADIVRGATKYIFPSHKEHMRHLEIFSQPKIASGLAVSAVATNNVLFKTALYRDTDHRFDPRFCLTGGSDYHFFQQLLSNGAQAIMCQTGQVYSIVPPHRLTFHWIARRYIRVAAAQELSKKWRHIAWSIRVANAIKRIVKNLMHCMKLSIRAVRKQTHPYHPIFILASNVGTCMGLLGLCPKEYR